MPNIEKVSPDAVCDALREAHGIKSQAARLLDVSRWTVDNMIERYPHIQKIYLDEKDHLLDVSESKLYKAIKDDSNPKLQLSAVKFHLLNQGQGRGYGNPNFSLERVKRSLGDPKKLNLDALTTDELKTLRTLIKKASNAKQAVAYEAVRSTDFTAKEAARKIRQLDDPEIIDDFITGDKRMTVNKAAIQRINALD